MSNGPAQESCQRQPRLGGLTAFAWAGAFWVAVAPLAQCLYGSVQNEGLPSVAQEPRAIVHYSGIVEFRQSLAVIDPDDKQAQRELAYSHEDLARVQIQFGDVAEGLESCHSSLRIKQKLLEADPNDAKAQRDLSVALEWLGNALLQARRYDEALEQHQQRLEISRRLALSEPESKLAQSDLSVAYQNVAAALLKFRRIDEALTLYRSMLEVNAKLAASQPNIARLQFGLFVSHQRIALTLAKMNRYDEAAESYRRGLEILRLLKERNQLGLGDEKWIGVGELVVKKYTHAAVALGAWETLLEQPAELLPLLLDLRGTQFAQEGRFAEAMQAADTLRELHGVPVWPLYNAACVYCLCAEAIPVDDSNPTSEKTTARERYIANAFATLRESFDNGWDEIAHLQQDPELTVLKDRPEFQIIVDELKVRVKAADRDLHRTK